MLFDDAGAGDPVVERPAPDLASAIVWFDALVSNVDRTARNTNLLAWHRRLWLIDHGAAFYFHHGGDDWLARAADPFARIRDHVLLPFATRLREADERLAPLLTPAAIGRIVEDIPAAWVDADAAPGERRAAYARYLERRLALPHAFVEEAERARL